MSVREEVGLLRDTCHIILDSMKVLWMHRDGGFTDLQHRNVGHHMEVPGANRRHLRTSAPTLRGYFSVDSESLQPAVLVYDILSIYAHRICSHALVSTLSSL